nr:unnamed protein product [Callosobruchus chinensis]
MVDVTKEIVIVMVLLLFTNYLCVAQDLLFPDQIEGNRLKVHSRQKDAVSDTATQVPVIVDRTIIDTKCNKGMKIRNRCRQIASLV